MSDDVIVSKERVSSDEINKGENWKCSSSRSIYVHASSYARNFYTYIILIIAHGNADFNAIRTDVNRDNDI